MPFLENGRRGKMSLVVPRNQDSLRLAERIILAIEIENTKWQCDNDQQDLNPMLSNKSTQKTDYTEHDGDIQPRAALIQTCTAALGIYKHVPHTWQQLQDWVTNRTHDSRIVGLQAPRMALCPLGVPQTNITAGAATKTKWWNIYIYIYAYLVSCSDNV